MLLSDEEIIELCFSTQKMVNPFVPTQVRQIDRPVFDYEITEKVISYGTSSYGYDIRLGRDFKVFTNMFTTVVDPKGLDPKAFVEFNDVDHILIPPNSFALAKSFETINVPRDILVMCIGKSTYARCGIIVNVTPLEPEWRGEITIEISNTTPLPAKIYSEEGIAQLLFMRGSKPCRTSYADKNGKYQDQTGITLPKV